jgi:hypothetical protein
LKPKSTIDQEQLRPLLSGYSVFSINEF